VSGRIIDADVDAIANIARLTGQVATLQEQWLSKHNALVEAYASLRKSDAQRDELQRLLTACEEERDAANERIAVNEKLLATRDELLAMFDCPEHGACVPHAKEEVTRLRAEVAATKAQLARVMAILPDALLWVEAESINLSDAMPYEACIDEIKAILADADSKVT
jgi:chromosome segregation ATPase